MYALVTTHRGVIMSVVIGSTSGALRAHLRVSLGAGTLPLQWRNYGSHWGVVTADGLTSHTIHKTTESTVF